MSNEEIIKAFYTAFANGDSGQMVKYYHSNIEFKDPAFGTLKGDRAKAMWHMLLERSKGELKITFSNVSADEEYGSVNWVADYTYGVKKRPVNNRIYGVFEFENGKIIKHTDHFNRWRWSRQALGFSGLILGWSGFMKRKIQSTTNRLLDNYINGKSG